MHKNFSKPYKPNLSMKNKKKNILSQTVSSCNFKTVWKYRNDHSQIKNNASFVSCQSGRSTIKDNESVIS